MPGLAIANEAHPVAGDEDAGQEGQPPDAAEDVQAEECVGEDQAMTREAKLRLEAKSPAHLLTHLPMNNDCDICQAGKLRQKPARRRRKDAELFKSVDWPCLVRGVEGVPLPVEPPPESGFPNWACSFFN